MLSFARSLPWFIKSSKKKKKGKKYNDKFDCALKRKGKFIPRK